MAKIPKVDTLIDAIDQAVVNSTDTSPRHHLGASQIGKPCSRALWYDFRWATTENEFDGRMLRLFARGQREEEVFSNLLKLAGASVILEDSQGRQYRFIEEDLGGHFSGSIDGIVHNLPEAPKTTHVCEFKTHSDKSFQKLCKEGVRKSKPEHFAQMQIYMRWTDLDRALYMAVNKNDDCLYIERIAYDKEFAQSMVNRATTIVTSNVPPPKIHADPAWFECKFCKHNPICHGSALPSVNCRTCMHSTPLVGKDRQMADWHCAKWDAEIPRENLAETMDCHRYIPDLIPWAEAINATENGAIIYQMKDGSGRQFINGETQQELLSSELRAIDPDHIADPNIEALKKNSMQESLKDQIAETEDDDVPWN